MKLMTAGKQSPVGSWGMRSSLNAVVMEKEVQRWTVGLQANPDETVLRGAAAGQVGMLE